MEIESDLSETFISMENLLQELTHLDDENPKVRMFFEHLGHGIQIYQNIECQLMVDDNGREVYGRFLKRVNLYILMNHSAHKLKLPWGDFMKAWRKLELRANPTNARNDEASERSTENHTKKNEMTVTL